MKKITLCLVLILAIIIVPATIFAAEGNVAKIGNTEYATLVDAVADVPADNTQTKITLLKNVEDGPGIVVNNKQNVVIDFNGFSYDASKPTVGSAGTETISLQILKGSKVTLKNGTLTSKSAKRIIQDYSDLTLENMVIDGTKSSNEIGYVISFINGNVNITGKTSIIASEGKNAFDNYFWPEYGYTEGARITINTTGTIKGNIELASSTKGLEKTLPSTLTIKNVNHDGKINVVDERFKEAFTIEGGIFSSDVKAYLADGLICPKINDEFIVVSDVEYKITVNNVTGGEVVVNKEKAQYGEVVNFTITTEKGYKLISLEVAGKNMGADLIGNDSFLMVYDSDVVIKPVFIKLTQDVQVPSEVADEKEVEAMILESLKELISADKELAADIEGKNVEVEVQVKTVDAEKIDKEEKEQIEKEAAKEVGDIKITQYIDITILVKDADTDEKIDELEKVKKAITFTVAKPELPEVAEGYTRIFYVIRNHNGDIDVWEAKEVDGKLSFESDKFSTYAIAYKDIENSGEGEIEVQPPEDNKEDNKTEDKPTTPDVPKTGDNIIIFAVIAVISIAGILVAIKMRKK